jgi:hypothetical protein
MEDVHELKQPAINSSAKQIQMILNRPYLNEFRTKVSKPVPK